MYGPGQTHRDAPLTPGQLTAWHFILGAVIVGGLMFLILGGVLHWG